MTPTDPPLALVEKLTMITTNSDNDADNDPHLPLLIMITTIALPMIKPIMIMMIMIITILMIMPSNDPCRQYRQILVMIMTPTNHC